MVELVDTADSKSAAVGRVGSSPTEGTKLFASVVELVYTPSSEGGPHRGCGFESHQTHQIRTEAVTPALDELGRSVTPSRYFSSVLLGGSGSAEQAMSVRTGRV